jgi:hypothetical protein
MYLEERKSADEVVIGKLVLKRGGEKGRVSAALIGPGIWPVLRNLV